VEAAYPNTPAGTPGRKRGGAKRWFLHTGLLFAFAGIGGALVIWPQWLAAEQAWTAVRAQASQERELVARVRQMSLPSSAAEAWPQDRRRVFLEDEVEQYPVIARAVARREGARVELVQITSHPSRRWRSQSVPPPSPVTTPEDPWAGEGPAGFSLTPGEIQPRTVRIVLTGDFKSIYRAVTSLCNQQQLFIPDAWDLTVVPPKGRKPGEEKPAATELRAEISATLFVVREPEEEQTQPVVAGPAGTSTPLEKEG
jgi:hypothetical protein